MGSSNNTRDRPLQPGGQLTTTGLPVERGRRHEFAPDSLPWREMVSNHRYLQDKLPLRDGHLTVPPPERASFLFAAGNRRFTVGGSGKSVARCHRTVLAYWKFGIHLPPGESHANFRFLSGGVLGDDVLNLAQKISSHCLDFFQRHQRQNRKKDDASPRQETNR
jgi:hypothetical protein